jgi:hypothetical protein
MLLPLIAILAASPSAVDQAESAHLRGALTGKVRLITSNAEMPLSQMNPGQLKAEYERLDQTRPTQAGPITMVVMGGVATLGGVLTLMATGLYSWAARSFQVVPFAIGLGLVVGGVTLLIVGIVVIRRVAVERQAFSDAMDDIKRLLEGNSQDSELPVASPPPLPNVTQLPVNQVQWVLARF